MNVAIVEQRTQAITIKEMDPEEPSRLKDFTYFAKPHETFCRENLGFLLKHLRENQFETGLHTLINTDVLHDTHYKHLVMSMLQSGDKIQLRINVNYVTEADSSSLHLIKMLKTPVK